MNNLKSRLNGLVGMQNIYRLILSVIMLSGMLGMAPAAQSASNVGNSVTCQLFSVYTTVQTAIFVIGILLMILGGALYAASHVMPGQSKGTMQGYAMGMIMGGIIGVIIAILSPYIFGLIGGQTAQNALSNAASTTCP